MSWNYRIVKYVDEMGFGIHEVYYDDNGKPDGYVATAVTSSFETDFKKAKAEMMEDLENVTIALGRDFINAEDM